VNSAQRDKTLLDRLAAEGTRLIEADDWRPDERLLEGWDHHPGDSGLTRRQVLDRLLGRAS
jgi:hypothetical protein